MVGAAGGVGGVGGGGGGGLGWWKRKRRPHCGSLDFGLFGVNAIIMS